MKIQQPTDTLFSIAWEHQRPDFFRDVHESFAFRGILLALNSDDNGPKTQWHNALNKKGKIL